ncbi:MAG: DUF3024 domain-containing protein [Chitinispirillaceae bacterium]
MSLSESELNIVDKAVSEFIEGRRPAPELRDRVDLGYRIEGQSVYIFEIRPKWNAPRQKQESPIAKSTYVATQKVWKIFWMRANRKWHRYDPVPEVKRIEDFLSVVSKDEHSCFFG